MQTLNNQPVETPDFEALANEARAKLVGRNPAPLVTGGVIGTLALFSLTNPIGAAAGALMTIGMLQKWIKGNEEDWKRLKKGEFFHLLPYDEKNNLERFFGEEAFQKALEGDYGPVNMIVFNNTVNTQIHNTTINIQNNYGANPTSDRNADSPGINGTAETTLLQSDREVTVDVPVSDSVGDLPVTQLQDATVLQPEQIREIYVPIQETKRRFESPGYEVIVSNTHQPQPIEYTPDIDPTEFEWVDDLRYAPFVLIYGAQGAGKSTVAEWLCYERLAMGHRVDICDPHTHYGQWQGLNVVGAGMAYLKIDAYLKDALGKIKARYQNLATQPNCNFQPVSILLEELTNWEAEVPIAGEFARKSWSDFRKAAYCVIMVSHDNTLQATGGAKGVAKAKKSTMLELQLFAQNVPGTTKLQPTGWGELTYPDGRKRKVKIPDWFQTPKIPVSQNHIVDANKMVSPVPAMAQSVIAETIAAESENPQQLVNAQSQANFERIHAERAGSAPKCPIELTQAILRCQELLGDKWTNEHLDTMLAPDDHDSYHKCLHKCLCDLNMSIGAFCRDVCKKKDSGAFRTKASEYYNWLEGKYGEKIYKP